MTVCRVSLGVTPCVPRGRGGTLFLSLALAELVSKMLFVMDTWAGLATATPSTCTAPPVPSDAFTDVPWLPAE